MVVGDSLTTASDLRADLFLSVIELNADALAQVFNVRPEALPLGNPLCAFRFWTRAAAAALAALPHAGAHHRHLVRRFAASFNTGRDRRAGLIDDAACVT